MTLPDGQEPEATPDGAAGDDAAAPSRDAVPPAAAEPQRPPESGAKRRRPRRKARRRSRSARSQRRTEGRAPRAAKEAEPKEAPRVAPPPGSINEVLAAALPGVPIDGVHGARHEGRVGRRRGRARRRPGGDDGVPRRRAARPEVPALPLRRRLAGGGPRGRLPPLLVHEEAQPHGEDARAVRRRERAEHRRDLSGGGLARARDARHVRDRLRGPPEPACRCCCRRT